MASEFPKDTIGQPPAGGGMVGRIKRLLLSPAAEWHAIDAEPDTAKGLFMRWAVPLAAIPAICLFVGMQIFGINLFLVTVRPGLTWSLITCALQYVGALGLVWILALVIDGLAPNFGSTKNQNQAMKVAAYSFTAAWVVGVLSLIPTLGLIGSLIGLYSFYLLWVGLPILMKTPADKAPTYTIVSIVVTIVVYLIIRWAIGLVTMNMMMANPAMMPGGGGSVSIGGTTIDTSKLQAQADAIKASTEKMQASLNGNGGAGTKAVDPSALQGLMPTSLSGWNRTSIESSGGGAMGVNVSDATAQFAAGDQSFRLKIADTGAMGALAGIVNVTSSRQTATGYEKTALQDGNMVTEEWDNQSKSGKYSVLVGKRFLVEAEGSAPNIDALKGAVGAVNLSQLAALGG